MPDNRTAYSMWPGQCMEPYISLLPATCQNMPPGFGSQKPLQSALPTKPKGHKERP